MSHMAAGSAPVHLGDGRTLAPGETVSRLDLKDDTNRRHVEAGRLVEIKTKTKAAKKTTKEDA